MVFDLIGQTYLTKLIGTVELAAKIWTDVTYITESEVHAQLLLVICSSEL